MVLVFPKYEVNRPSGLGGVRGQTDRQTHTHTQTDRQTDRQTDGLRVLEYRLYVKRFAIPRSFILRSRKAHSMWLISRLL